jgi:hypothetical protein
MNPTCERLSCVLELLTWGDLALDTILVDVARDGDGHIKLVRVWVRRLGFSQLLDLT